MKCLIAYFSQTNSTRKIAESIGKELTVYDWEVDFKNIKEDKSVNIEEYDLFGFGTPVYYYRLPFLVKDFLQSLPDLKNKPVFSFITYGTYYFGVPVEINNILKEKSTHNIGFFAARGADKYLGYLKQGVLLSDGHPNKRELTQAKHFANSLLKYFQEESNSENIYKLKKENKKGIIYNFESLLTKALS
ncbi:MAG: flavodoxin domain-containing protein [Halanaerobiales bacterium]|nr:flavodoxin domain-containing protein [Halanaerobiales bacterium]